MAKKKDRGRPQKGDLEKGEEVTQALTTKQIEEAENVDDYEGLTDRQKTIARMRLRGLSQKAIGTVLGVSQPVISKEVKRIRTHMQEKGAFIDQDHIIGETTTIYEEVMERAWEVYHQKDTSASDELKALSLIMTAREKHVKLLMDLGRIERAGSKSTIEIKASPLLESWSQETRQEVSAQIIETQLSALPEPTPPEEEEAIDAEFEDQ